MEDDQDNDVTMVDAAVPSESTSADSTDGDSGKQARRRMRNVNFLTSGLGSPERMGKLTKSFWESIWPALESIGWKKVGWVARLHPNLLATELQYTYFDLVEVTVATSSARICASPF